MAINILHNISTEQWNELLQESHTASFFQSPGCKAFYDSLSFIDSHVLAVQENNKITGLILAYIQKDCNSIKHYFSRRAIIIGGPLLSQDITTPALETLLQECKTYYMHKAIYTEIRNLNDYSAYKIVFEKQGFKYKQHYNIKLSTVDFDTTYNAFSINRKRNIKSSFKQGVSIIDMPSETQIKEFYSILQRLYKSKIKKPIFNLEFFEKLNQFDFSKIILVEFNAKIIGGIVCVMLKNKAVYEWYICGDTTDNKFVHASTMATYAGIKFACDNNFQYFDMMGAGEPKSAYGVRDFKLRFGGSLIDNGRFLCVHNALLYRFGNFVLKLLHFKL